MPFSNTHNNGIEHWNPTIDAQNAHDCILDALRKLPVTFLPLGSALNTRRKGNIGEFVAFFVGKHCNGINSVSKPFPANAFTPLANISKPDVDIVWVCFFDNPDDDYLVLQEVKTSSDPTLSIARELRDDYRKLFGLNPNFNLNTKISVIKSQFEYQHQRQDLAIRLNKFAGAKPNQCFQTILKPTLVVDGGISSTDVENKLIAVSTALFNLGWSSLQPMSVKLDTLDERFKRIQEGQP